MAILRKKLPVPPDRKRWVEELAEKAERLEGDLQDPERLRSASQELRAAVGSAEGHVRWARKILRDWLARTP